MMDKLGQFFESLFVDQNVLKSVLSALLILIVGYFVALFLRRITKKLMMRLSDKVQNRDGLAKTVSKLVYYLALTYVLILVLNRLGFSNVLKPLQDMLSKVAGFLPNIAVGGLIGFVGYTLANIAKETVGLFSETLDNLSAKFGISDTMSVSKLAKQLVFLIIFIPISILALDALQMKAISEPATEMLGTMMNSIPNILAAALILIIFWVVGRYVISMLTELIHNLGADTLPAKLGMTNMLGESRSLSKMIGNVAFFFLMFAGIIAAMDKLQFGEFSTILRDLFDMTGKIFLGLVIMALGNFISLKASEYMNSTGAEGLATVVRFATLGLFLAIALRTMGLADDIVNMAFGLTLGAVAVAFALSFGLGGREAAGKQMEHWLKRFRD